MQYHRLKATYDGKVLKPERALDIPEGTEVTLIVVVPFRTFRGLLSEVKEDGVTLQHKMKEIWGPHAN